MLLLQELAQLAKDCRKLPAAEDVGVVQRRRSAI
jgi:hypothetical protein